MSIFICPVCGGVFDEEKSCYTCRNGHSFDKAKSGYVNLLLNHTSKTVHGDNKLMIQARREFLDRGYYEPLKNALCNTVQRYFNGGAVLDAGCGEGYYTSAVKAALPEADMYGIDISKTAADFSAKRCKSASFAAASVFHIPVADKSCGMLITLFAPYCGEEFQRVLRDEGTMIMVIPSEMHLWELKQAVYDVPYKNKVKPYELDGFELAEKQRISYKIKLSSQQDIKSLFSMTPYYYRTGRMQQERLESLDSLETQVDFELLVYIQEDSASPHLRQE